MHRFEIRADNVDGLGSVVITEPTPIGPKLIATFTPEKAQTALRLEQAGIQSVMKTFADGVERMVNVETNAAALQGVNLPK